jgi:glycolate oxidase
LGIVTKIVLKLIPYPKYELLMLVPFASLDQAGEAVSAIFRAGFTPSALELIEIDALRIGNRFLKTNFVSDHEKIEAHLLIEVDGNHRESLMADMESITELLSKYEVGEILFAEDEEQKKSLWILRRRLLDAVKSEGYTIEEDTVVPRASLPALIRGIKKLGLEYGFQSVCYGHAGDGNLHIRIKKEGSPNSQDNPEIVKSIRAMFELVRELGGTISGEHGVGIIQKPYLDIVFNNTQIDLMRDIKKAFDPNFILNAGKIFDIE